MAIEDSLGWASVETASAMATVMDGEVSGVPMEIFPFDMDHGAACRARIGTIVYSVDETIESDFETFFFDRPGVVNYHSRIAKGPGITEEGLEKTKKMIPPAAALLPNQTFHAVGMACTSLAVTIGENVIADLVSKGAKVPAALVTNPLTAAKRAFKALGVTKVAVLTPYTEDITAGLVTAFDSSGLKVVRLASFNQTLDEIVVRIAPQSILKVVEQIVATSRDIEGVFVSCTDTRILPILLEAEAKTKVPLVSSNTAMAWDMLRLAGALTDGDRAGQHQAAGGALFRVPMPGQGPRGPCP